MNEAFSTTWLSNCCRFPWGCPGKPDRENGHRTFSGFRRLAPGIPGAWTLVYVGGAALVISATTSAPIFLHSLALAFASLVSVSGGVYSPMGWQQYSRPLWLSRGNHYILYLKAMTAQMRVWWTGFPQLRPSRARLHGELHCLDRVVHCSMSISAGPDLLFRLTQDFRPWLLSVAPFGAGAWWCSLCSSTQSVRLTRRSDSSDLRTCTSNRFGLAVLGARTRRPGCVSTAMCLRSFALLRGADARPPQAMD